MFTQIHLRNQITYQPQKRTRWIKFSKTLKPNLDKLSKLVGYNLVKTFLYNSEKN